MTGSLLIWDAEHDVDAHAADLVFLWRSHAEAHGVRSIPRYLEDHADPLRSRYLRFVTDLGAQQVSGRTLVDHLDRGDGFSYWWMGLIHEKSPFKSPRIYDCLRVFALEELLSEYRPEGVLLVSDDRALAIVVQALCATLGVRCRWRRSKSARTTQSVRQRLLDMVPSPLRGVLAMLRFLALRWSLRNRATPPWFGGDRARMFFSYFIHLDAEKCRAGTFTSGHWGPLPALLRDAGLQANWCHHFLFSDAVASPRAADALCTTFNANAESEGVHGFIDSRLSVAIFACAAWDYIRLARARVRLEGAARRMRVAGSSANLWPLFRRDWASTLTGSAAMMNCLWVAQFDALLREVPHQSLGFYLFENQGWEKAMLRAWRRHGHGKMVAVQHATVPYWHLYYASGADPESSVHRCREVRPDQIVVNGSASHGAMIAFGHPPEMLLQVEALRYLDLGSVGAGEARQPTISSGVREDTGTSLLVLGDLSPRTIDRFMRCVEAAVGMLEHRPQVLLKAHPGLPIATLDFPRLEAVPADDRLDVLLPHVDVAIVANSTSASVDAFVFGVPTIIMLDGSSLNLSPLRGHANVWFVDSAHEMATAIEEARQRGRQRAAPMFLPGHDLLRWRDLLAVAPSTGGHS